MIKKHLASVFFFYFFFSTANHAHIDAALQMNLVGNRTVILVFDNYKGVARDKNQLNAVVIAQAINNFAKAQPHASIEMSYEDPAVYDAGTDLRFFLPKMNQVSTNLRTDSFIGLVPQASGQMLFDMMAFTRPSSFSSFLTGDLTNALWLMAPETLPSNLTVRSNDPRREHYLALTKSKTWLLSHAKTIMMRDLLTASPMLLAKRVFFNIDSSLSIVQQNRILDFIKEFSEAETGELERFTYFAAKFKQDIELDDVNKTIEDFAREIKLPAQSISAIMSNSAVIDKEAKIQELKTKFALEMVYQFLDSRKKLERDIYIDAPIVDILLTMFSQQHPDTMVIILGNYLAEKLGRMLGEKDLNVVDSGGDIPDPITYFTRLAMKNLEQTTMRTEEDGSSEQEGNSSDTAQHLGQ